MAYIVVKLSGEKKRGGFLKIDGGAQTELFDGTVLKVSEGAHHLEYSSQADLAKAGKDLLNIFTDNALQNVAKSKDYDMTERFEKNSVMLFEVVSDAFGRILGAPDCRMTVASDEKMRELDEAYQDYLKGDEEETEEAEEKAKKTHNKLMLFSVLTFFTVIGPIIFMFTGYIKQIKFLKQYGRKPKHSGLQQFVSLLCVVGGIVLLTSLTR